MFLFEDASTAVRGASMRALLERGVDPNQLRALEDLVKTLARLPVEAWEGKPVDARPPRPAPPRGARSCASAGPRRRARRLVASPAARAAVGGSPPSA